MKKVLILGAGPLQVPAIKTAKELGCYVFCCDYNPEAIGFSFADKRKVISTTDIKAVLAYAASEKVDYVITSASDAPVRTAAFVSEELNLPYSINYENAKAATFKNIMRDRLKTYGVPMPSYTACTTYEEFCNALQSYSYNCIVKPADSAASRGVRLVSSYEIDKKQYFEETLSYSNSKIIMVEEMAVGPEVSVEAITIENETHIIAITDKEKTAPPYFVEIGHSEPSSLPKETQNEIEKITKQVIKAIGLINGPSHTEIIITNEGPKVIETAARLGGDYITAQLVPLSTGVQVAEESVKLALDEKYNFKKTMNNESAIYFLTAKKPGYIESIDIDPKLETFSEVKEYNISCSIGEYVKPPQSSNDRLGHIIVSCSLGENAAKKARQYASYINIQISPHKAVKSK